MKGALPNPYLCNGGPWHGQHLWLCHGSSGTIRFNVMTYVGSPADLESLPKHWSGRYKLRIPRELGRTPLSVSKACPIIDWEGSDA